MNTLNFGQPHGQKVMWIGRYPPLEGLPPQMPGVIVEWLPDGPSGGMALVAWVDKAGWQVPDAVFEAKNLRPASEAEFGTRVRELRASDWAGLPASAPFREGERVDFLPGMRVRWAGPFPEDSVWQAQAFREWAEGALGGVLAHAHPGTVVSVNRDGEPMIHWAGHESAGRIAVPRGYLARIDEAEYAARASKVHVGRRTC